MQIHEGVMLGAGVLHCHPQTPASAVASVGYELALDHTGSWRLSCIIGCPPNGLRLPASAEPQRRDGLWQSTCFEAFFLDEASGVYVEYNFSPSGEWAAYRFGSYRRGQADLDCPTPQIVTTAPQQAEDALKRLAEKHGLDPGMVDLLGPLGGDDAPQFGISATMEGPPLAGAGPWRLALSAVIEETDGTKSYWALRHPPGAPDFHHPDCFALTLGAPRPL